MRMISRSARMIGTLQVFHRPTLAHPTVRNVATALCQSRQLHAIARCLLGRLQLGEIEPLAPTQAVVAALAAVSGASLPPPLAQGPAAVDLSSGAAQASSDIVLSWEATHRRRFQYGRRLSRSVNMVQRGFIAGTVCSATSAAARAIRFSDEAPHGCGVTSVAWMCPFLSLGGFGNGKSCEAGSPGKCDEQISGQI